MARLWKVIHGEPYMINPHLGIIGLGANPKKRGKKMARRSGARHMAWVRSHKKNRPRKARRGYRRNPYALAGPAAAAMNPRRRYRRNPGGGGRRTLFNLPPLTAVMYGGVGFAGTAAVEGFANQFVPLEWQGNMLGKYAVRLGSLIGVTWLSRMIFGKGPSYMIGIGGGLYVLTTAVREFMPGVIPGMGQPARLAGPLNLAAYRQMRGGNYVAPGIGAYRESRGMASPMIGQPNTSATGGATNVVAARFRRFN